MEEHHIGGEDMAKTLDDMVDERVEKRVREIMKPLLKRMELMEKAIETLEKWRDDALAIDGERLINNGVDYRLTCAKINISGKTYYNFLDDIRVYASLCAAQLGMIKVC